MSPFTNMLYRLFPTPWRKLPDYPAILCLDACTLQKIYQYLSLVDRVCLSLSCKELFALFGTIVKHKDLVFPRLLHIRAPILCVNSQDVPRNQLLLRLEDRRWAYCGKCLKLHPRKEFPRYLLRESALERSCTFYAGIADLCPCISLTIRAREQLVKILKSPAKPVKTEYGLFEYQLVDGGKPRLRHCCRYKHSTQPSYHIQVDLVLLITDTGQLCVLAQYNVTISKGYGLYEPSFACPHVDLLNHIPVEKATHDPLRYQKVLPKPHKDLLPYEDLLSLVPGTWVIKACSQCQTLVRKDDLCEDINQAGFWVIRNLGSHEWPASRIWAHQCRMTGVNFWRHDLYW